MALHRLLRHCALCVFFFFCIIVCDARVCTGRGLSFSTPSLKPRAVDCPTRCDHRSPAKSRMHPSSPKETGSRLRTPCFPGFEAIDGRPIWRRSFHSAIADEKSSQLPPGPKNSKSALRARISQYLGIIHDAKDEVVLLLLVVVVLSCGHRSATVFSSQPRSGRSPRAAAPPPCRAASSHRAPTPVCEVPVCS